MAAVRERPSDRVDIMSVDPGRVNQAHVDSSALAGAHVVAKQQVAEVDRNRRDLAAAPVITVRRMTIFETARARPQHPRLCLIDVTAALPSATSSRYAMSQAYKVSVTGRPCYCDISRRCSALSPCSSRSTSYRTPNSSVYSRLLDS